MLFFILFIIFILFLFYFYFIFILFLFYFLFYYFFSNILKQSILRNSPNLLQLNVRNCINIHDCKWFDPLLSYPLEEVDLSVCEITDEVITKYIFI